LEEEARIDHSVGEIVEDSKAIASSKAGKGLRGQLAAEVRPCGETSTI
jgi:hypothetical protein